MASSSLRSMPVPGLSTLWSIVAQASACEQPYSSQPFRYSRYRYLFAPRSADHLALRNQRVLDPPEHLLVAHAFTPHVLAVLAQQVAHFVVQAVFSREFLADHRVDLFRHAIGRRS